jgi:hypothetical protein
MAITSDKLLNRKNNDQKMISSGGPSNVVLTKKSVKDIASIKVNVIKIESILKGTLAAEKKSLDAKKRQESGKRREKQEEKLETKPQAEKGPIKMPKAPRMGFLDWIKNFIGNVILGYFAVRMLKYLPLLKPILKFVGQATDFVLNVGGKLLDGLVTFIDWGYKAYDASRGFIKNLFGENGVKQFDQLSGLLNNFLNLAIIAGMIAAGSGGGGRGGGPGAGTRPRPGQGGRPRVTASGGGGAGRPDIRNPLRQRPTVTTGGKPQFRLPGTGPKITGSGAKGILSSVRPFLKRIPLPVVGALIDFGLSVALGEDPGRAAFRAIGAGLLGAVGAAAGSVVPVAGNFLGGLAGGFVGDAVGGALYDAFFGGKTKKSAIKGRVGGGPTRGGKTQGGASRKLSASKVKKYKRKLARKPGDIEIDNPGADVGGEDKLFGLFPNPLKAVKKIISPFNTIKESGTTLGKTDYFGPILAITSKILSGEKPSQKDYENVGLGINLLLSKGIQDGQLKGGLAAAFQTGGLVDPQSIFAAAEGGDVSSWVADTFKSSIETNAQKTLRMIRENADKNDTGEKTKEEEGGGVDEDGGMEVGPAGSSGDKLTMARNLMRDLKLTPAQAAGIVGNMAAESGVENARPQGSSPGTKAPLRVDGVTGYGLVQWTSKGRQQALADFAKSRGADLSKPLSMNIEYQFFLKEFQGSYGKVLSQIRQAQDVKAASTIFMQQYEIPAGYKTNAKIMERYNMSKPIYDQLAMGKGKATEGVGTYIGPVGDVGDGTVGKAGSKAARIIAGAKKILGMDRGVSNGCAITTRAALKAGGLASLANKVSKGDLDTPKGYIKGLEGAGGLAGSDIGKVIRNKSQVKGGDIIFWRGGGGYVGGDKAVTHVGIAADDGLKNQYDHNTERGFQYRPFWTGYAGRNWFAAVRPFAEGGIVDNPVLGLLGEEGKREGVIGGRVAEYLEEMAPGTLPAIIGANSKQELANVLRTFSDYGFGPPEEIFVDAGDISDNMNDYGDSGSSGFAMAFAGGGNDDPFDTLYQGG